MKTILKDSKSKVFFKYTVTSNAHLYKNTIQTFLSLPFKMHIVIDNKIFFEDDHKITGNICDRYNFCFYFENSLKLIKHYLNC